MTPNFAITTWPCKYADDILQLADRTGIDAVEWNINFLPLPLDPNRLSNLAHRFEAYGLSLRYHLPHSTCDPLHPEENIRRVSADFLKLNLSLVRRLGGHYTVLHAGSGLSQQSHTTLDSLPLATLTSLVYFANDHDIILSIENLAHGPMADPSLLSSVASHVGAHITFDVGHAVSNVGINNLGTFVSRIGAPITHVHVYGREDQDFNHKPIATKADAQLIARALMNSTASDWWTLEMLSVSDCMSTKSLLEQSTAALSE